MRKLLPRSTPEAEGISSAALLAFSGRSKNWIPSTASWSCGTAG